MPKTATRSVELEPLDRLEEKVKRLVEMIERVKIEQARTLHENERLTRELDAARTRLADGESVASEMATLKEERDVIRLRVTEMLEQLEALNL